MYLCLAGWLADPGKVLIGDTKAYLDRIPFLLSQLGQLEIWKSYLAGQSSSDL